MAPRNSSPGLILGLAAALTLFAAAASAAATEVTRDSYREAVEPICQANATANERILSGARAQVKHDQLGPAAVKFSKAAKALKGTIRQLRAVPQPSADSARLVKWLAMVGTEATLFESAAAKLRAGNKGAASQVVIHLTHNATQANNIVIPFEFHYCRFEPSKYT